MKRVAIGLLGLTIVLEVAWMAVRHYRHHTGILQLWYPLVTTVAFAALAVTRGRVRWIAAALRILIGLAFASAVADRLGLMGGPDSPGVAWGTFPRFVIYTGQINTFLPAAVTPLWPWLRRSSRESWGLPCWSVGSFELRSGDPPRCCLRSPLR